MRQGSVAFPEKSSFKQVSIFNVFDPYRDHTFEYFGAVKIVPSFFIYFVISQPVSDWTVCKMGETKAQRKVWLST